jgi:hypothetical protein
MNTIDSAFMKTNFSRGWNLFSIMSIRPSHGKTYLPIFINDIVFIGNKLNKVKEN